ncbi:uncharacterized protein LOC122073554 [Macadamia integrifolia]|uniref:uncharacterized protein LOC122073554 n=1 Tax=Macadamia integrifolia TaxID=60698 RepID=UPI001C4E7B9D|nr:uncharacterized protein LOC122073554 [Macadamia integrifolia]
MSTEAPPVTVRPKLVTLNKAFQLAESWVNDMNGSAAEDSTEVEFEGRPLRLGLGAKVIHQSKRRALTDPVERKLRAKLDAGKRKAAQSIEESNPSEQNDILGEDDSEDEVSESRTNAFLKKRWTLPASSLHGKKKHK